MPFQTQKTTVLPRRKFHQKWRLNRDQKSSAYLPLNTYNSCCDDCVQTNRFIGEVIATGQVGHNSESESGEFSHNMMFRVRIVDEEESWTRRHKDSSLQVVMGSCWTCRGWGTQIKTKKHFSRGRFMMKLGCGGSKAVGERQHLNSRD